ncbi:MAG: AgmX/PglI C-terminal domain-containing protein [Deltaproteobacteria bacterium]|nr:AgmX/PglI C-terminal domain-containing protein [Deltaproteobacteria bacterium]
MNGSLAIIVFAVSVTNVAATGFVGYRLRHMAPPATNSHYAPDTKDDKSATAEMSDAGLDRGQWNSAQAETSVPRASNAEGAEGTEIDGSTASAEGDWAHDDLDLAEERLALFEIAREHEARVEDLIKRTQSSTSESEPAVRAKARAARIASSASADPAGRAASSAHLTPPNAANVPDLDHLTVANNEEDDWDPLAKADLSGSARNEAEAPEASDTTDSEPRDKNVTSPLAMGSIRTRGVGNVSSGRKRETSVRAPSVANVPAADGDVSRKQLLRLIKGHIPSFRDCYERILKEHEGLEGKMRLTIDVMPSGRGSPVRIESDSVGNKDLRACIVRRSTHWRFPKPFRPVSLAFSVVFTPTL